MTQRTGIRLPLGPKALRARQLTRADALDGRYRSRKATAATSANIGGSRRIRVWRRSGADEELVLGRSQCRHDLGDGHGRDLGKRRKDRRGAHLRAHHPLGLAGGATVAVVTIAMSGCRVTKTASSTAKTCRTSNRFMTPSSMAEKSPEGKRAPVQLPSLVTAIRPGRRARRGSSSSILRFLFASRGAGQTALNSATQKRDRIGVRR
jgi:hypothetical protein